MRNPQRIEKFLERLDVPVLLETMKKKFPILSELDVDRRSAEIMSLINSKDFVSYWKDNPDLRFGQLLFNLNVGFMDAIYYDEESDILKLQGLPNRQSIMWTSFLDSEGNRLEEPRVKFIDELDASHLLKMIEEYTQNLRPYSEKIIKVFIEELIARNNNNPDIF